MGIFQKFFGSEPKYDALVKTCNLEMLRDAVLDFHQMVKEEGEAEGGEYVFRTEYVAEWYSFRDNPNIDNAQRLFEVAPHLRTLFESCSPGGELYWANSLGH